MSPSWDLLTQEKTEKFLSLLKEEFIIICGHYEWIDKRIIEKYDEIVINNKGSVRKIPKWVIKKLQSKNWRKFLLTTHISENTDYSLFDLDKMEFIFEKAQITRAFYENPENKENGVFSSITYYTTEERKWFWKILWKKYHFKTLIL